MVYISNYLGPVQVLYFTCAEFNATIEKNLVFSFIYIRLGKMWIASQLETRHYVTIFSSFSLSINQSISIIYFNTLRQRAKKLVQNTNVYK